jgi:hypothetical protein
MLKLQSRSFNGFPLGDFCGVTRRDARAEEQSGVRIIWVGKPQTENSLERLNT